MAAVAEMGEVDEIISKEEGGVMTNGDLSNDIDMENDSQDSLKKPSLPESMEVDEPEQQEVAKTQHPSSTEESNDCDEENENTAGEDEEEEASSVLSANEDESSQETKQSEEQEESGEEQEETKADDDDKPKSDEENSTEASEKPEAHDVVHEIHSDDEEKKSNSEPIELNDSGGEEGDGDVVIVDEPKQNGTSEVINLDESPQKKEPTTAEDEDVTPPRRSSRNLNKSKSYVESEKEDSPHVSEESDVEEVLPQDPLAVTVEKIPATGPKPAPIVVKNTKRLVEIASKTNASPPQGKKEPTLVIIDTNSILSGRGPLPINSKVTSTPVPPLSSPSYLPMALPAQGMYPPNMRATITPIPMTPPAKVAPTVTTPLLPTLTDDMFVVEAPSFIVPYVYEKPPVKDFKEFVADIKKEVKAKEEEEDSAEEDEKPKKEVPPAPPVEDEAKKPYSYFDSPLGKFFINIGFGLVQEFVQTDLLKQQKRKHGREGGSNPDTEKTIRSLAKNLETCRPQNEPFKLELRKCEFCNFKTESALAMAYHLETPHMRNFVYKCNFCAYEVRSPHDILFHMEAEHAVRGHLERAPAFHQCPNCPFEDNGKGKLSRHLVTCMRKFKPERNLEPPIDWEPPAKIPRVPKIRQQGLNATAAAYQAMSKSSQYQFLSKMQLQGSPNPVAAAHRGRGRPSLAGAGKAQQAVIRPQGMMLKQQNMSGGSVLVPTNYQLNQVFQVVGGQELSGRLGNPGHVFLPNMPSASSSAITMQNQSKKAGQQQPSISITPLPRGAAATVTPVPAAGAGSAAKPGDTASKNSFVICEICDGYIKDLEQLRNHMQWIHKIKIHPKMIYNRPPLNCQKCQFRFFTDQGLERHLLGSHGLVTSSMQDAANKSKDSGRCPVCGRVYQWKLLNHVARDHNMTLKPAHLSYKCTVCTATFGMYKQFENHVYSAHSVVAKRVMDKKAAPSTSGASTSKADLKPLKINDEITIIPQPAKSTNGAGKEAAQGGAKGGAAGASKNPEASSSSASRAERIAQRKVDVKE